MKMSDPAEDRFHSEEEIRSDTTIMGSNDLVQALLTDLYQITMAYAYWKCGKMEDESVFDLYFRKNPFQGEFTIFAGLEECVRLVQNFHFSDSDIEYLKTVMPPTTEPGFFNYLKNISAKQITLSAVPEGEVVFPKVPLITVMGPLAVVQLLETPLLNLVNYASLVATNAARFRMAAGPETVLLEFGLGRAQGPDGGLSASRYCYLGGFDGTSNVLAGKLFGIPVRGTHAHAFVTSYINLEDIKITTLKSADGLQEVDFVKLCLKYQKELSSLINFLPDQVVEGELAAFISYALAFPNGFLALIDTYDVIQSGLPNFCTVAMALQELGYRAQGIQLNSGDLSYLSKFVKSKYIRIAEHYNLPWFENLNIVASNDINEDTIHSLNQQGHTISCFGIGTHLVTCQKQPALGCIFKLVDVNKKARIKLSEDVEKVTIPGRKNVYRLYGADGTALVDLLQDSSEPAPQIGQRVLCRHPFQETKRAYVIPADVKSLHKIWWSNGKVVHYMPTLSELREKTKASLDSIRPDHKRTLNPTPYKKQEKFSCDRLSIFGLMVKPVQRFPQFIMLLQDLIKFTPHNHDDRMALQLALTELENVAYRLNERKRQSEQKFLARQIVQQLIKQKVQHVFDMRNLDLDPTRRLLRSDTIEQVLQNGEFKNMRCKDRRLILMNDYVLCVKVIQKEQSGNTVERYALRWMAKLKDLELKDSALSDIKSGFDQDPGNINIFQLPEGAHDDPYHLLADLHEMVHDSIILKKMTGLVSQLKRSYAGHGLRDGLIQEIWNDLQQMVQIKEEQLRLVNNCSIILQDNSRSDKPQYVLQAQRATIKQDWCIDFLIAKLALDKSNNLSWGGTSGSDGSDFDVIPAYFIKHLPVDVPKKYTQIKCAVSVYLSVKKSVRDLGLQHLWVCSSTPVCGQVSVLAAHNSKPALIESFRACGSEIMAVELVPGCNEFTKARELIFAEDTVWIATSQNEILIFPLTSDDGVHRHPLASVLTSLLIVSMKFIHEKLFCGSTSGVVTIYYRQQGGEWDISKPVNLNFGSACVKLYFVHEEHIWFSCGNKLYQLEITSLQTQAMFVLNDNQEAQIDQVVKSGVGIWVSFRDDSVIKLFHLETMENLQEISVGNFVSRIRTEKSWAMNLASENLSITCLTVSRGLLWIGTSLGVVLTVPLPRLSDGVPLYRGSPKLSLHAHKSPVRFIILLQCTPTLRKMNKSNTFFAANEPRQSLQNMARQEQELDGMHESEERTVANVTKLTKCLGVGEDMLSEPEEHCEKLSVSSLSTNSNISEQKTTKVKCDDSEINIPDSSKQLFTDKMERWTGLDGTSVELRNKCKSSVIDRRSKTLHFSSDLSHDNIMKFRNYSRSNMDLTSVEACEVEVLYKALLEDDPAVTKYVDNLELPDGKKGNWNYGNPVLAQLSSLSTDEVSASRQNTAPTAHGHQDSVRESQSETMKIGDGGNVTEEANSSHSQSLISSSFINFEDKTGVRTVTCYGESKTTGMTCAYKTNSNAVVVVSGGDGYCDLDMSRKEVKMDDACVLMWIHKFY